VRWWIGVLNLLARANGSITLVQVAAHTAGLAVACSRCDWGGQYRLETLIARHGPDFGIRSCCDCCRAIARSGTPSAPTTCAGVNCPDLPAFFRASPRPSVAALGLHGFTIRIRVSRAGVDWRVMRRRVQDRVAARRVFTRSRHSGLSTRRAHNVVVGFLCADSVGLRLVIPPRYTSGSKLLVKPVRRLNMCDGTRRSGGWYGWLLNTPSDQRDCDAGGQYEDDPHSVSLVAPPAAGIIIFSPLASHILSTALLDLEPMASRRLSGQCTQRAHQWGAPPIQPDQPA
jgi:hypothetical protein